MSEAMVPGSIRLYLRYVLCRIGQSFLPLSHQEFQEYAFFYLSDPDRLQFPVAPSNCPFDHASRTGQLEKIENHLCSRINRELTNNHQLDNELRTFSGARLRDGVDITLVGLRWLSQGTYTIREVDGGPSFGKGLVLKNSMRHGSCSSKDSLFIPLDTLRYIKFLDDRVVYRYKDLRTIHIFPNSGGWDFYPPIWLDGE